MTESHRAESLVLKGEFLGACREKTDPLLNLSVVEIEGGLDEGEPELRYDLYLLGEHPMVKNIKGSGGLPFKSDGPE